MRELFVVLLVIVARASAESQTFPQVHTTTGTVRGNRITLLDKEVHSYLGIPYATPPIGDLRFTKPEPIKPWDGIYEASRKPLACLQFRIAELPWTVPNDQVSEDCLYLNVWSPQRTNQKDSEDSLKPIMVWIYGGGFYSGSSSLDLYDGGVLAAYGDVIVASMNYRLGIFGFFSGNVKEAPGNMGLMDQVLALRWIKDNAKAFGGDPSRITIFGESAGAVSVGLHLLSPMSDGLFSRAIMQSGSPYHSLIGKASNAIESFKAETFAKTIGCSTEESNLISQPEQVISCLRGKDASELAKAESLLVSKYIVGFVPRMGNEFLPFNPVETLVEGKFNSTNLLIGTNSNEGSVFAYAALSQIMNLGESPKWSVDEGKTFVKTFFKDSLNPTTDIVAERYMNSIQKGDHEKVKQAVFDSLGDFLQLCPTMLFGESFAKMPGSEVYYYHFHTYPSHSAWPKWMEMAHFEEIQYVFGVPLRKPLSYTKEEVELSRYVMEKWTSFAKTGIPKCPEKEPWPKYTAEEHLSLEMKPNEYVISHEPRLQFCDFWRKYFV